MSLLARGLRRRSAIAGYATWNPTDKGSGIVLLNENLLAGGTPAGWQTVRATIGKNVGKHVFQITPTPGAPLYTMSGLCGSQAGAINSYLGGTSISIGYSQAQNDYYSNGFTPVVQKPTGNVPLFFAVDVSNKKCWIYSSGVWVGGGNPETGATPTITWSISDTIYPAASFYSTPAQTQSINTGQSSFIVAVPSGFNPGWYA